ncbi:MAG TPA: sigma-70 family RNA polymerase sigma factor, partial [Gemmataceae bacterium]|nr:sigma-70 family RNA polymerase sigma factor [Gemmataceae bacterium]
MNRTFGQLARVALDLGVTTDAQLLADFVARRDDAAFAALVRRHGPMVLAVCRRVLRHQQDSEDAFQATFLVLARKAEDVWPREAVGAWLHGVAYRVAMKARGVRAKLARREHPLEDAPQLPHESPCPDLARVLDRAIRKLPEVYRAAVVACDLEGRTRKDAAEQLGWKEGTLSGRLSRARQLLASRLRKMGLAVPVGVAFTNNTADALPAKLADTAVRASLDSHAAGVSAPVAALTEGVVRSMFLVKMKTAAVGVLAACMLGLGVWSASGQGPGAGGGQPAKGERPRVSGPSSAAATPSDLDRLQGEWVYGKRFIESGANPPREVVDAILSAAKKDGSLVTVDGTKIDIPSVVPDGDGVKVTPDYYTIKLDPTQSPKHIDLTDQNGRVTQGIYKFEDGCFH